MERINLCGKWYLKGAQYEGINATVPGCVHTDLLNEEKIPDPFYRDNEHSLMWIGETDWEYSRDFMVSEEMLLNKHIILSCEGLDTLAQIKINGKPSAQTDNMFRTWNFDIKNKLHPGKNNISIYFKSTIPYLEEKNGLRKFHPLEDSIDRMKGVSWIRKMQCSYGWDWGIKCVTCGIWKNIEIQAYNEAKINDVLVRQVHQKNLVRLNITVNLDQKSGKKMSGRVFLALDGKSISTSELHLDGAKGSADVEAENPKLWWPNNLGEQNLYDLLIEIYSDSCKLAVDTYRQKIGLRTLKLDRHPDRWGESFQFAVNGVPFFAKGANWIPIDAFVTRASDDFYEQVVASAAHANMNFLRVWGGGIYEKDIFYELCDKYGICVWQDFMFACSSYPAYDKEFMENVKLEAVDNIRRLRNHPCIALWCGNNELEQIPLLIDDDTGKGSMSWDEYKLLFDKLLPGLVGKHAPDMDYWPSSPHTPTEERDWSSPIAGDAHLWDVWHGTKPFEWYRTCEHRFNSEFGFQSFPEPFIVEGYTIPEDRNITSYIMEHHQRSPIGNNAIIQYMLSWYKLPKSFDMQIWLSQILHGMAMKYAVEHWRRSMPRGMGTLYWQLNDCWPVTSWASLDYTGNWKALNYMAKRFYAPVLASAVEDIEKGIVEIHLTNDLLENASGTLDWRLFDTDGTTIAADSFGAAVGPCTSLKLRDMDIKERLDRCGARNAMMHIEFIKDNISASDNLVLFSRPKHINLKNPGFCVNITKKSDIEYEVEITAAKPALWVWTIVQGQTPKFSDRFFHMLNNSSKKLTIELQAPMEKTEFMEKFKIYSLLDTYQS